MAMASGVVPESSVFLPREVIFIGLRERPMLEKETTDDRSQDNPRIAALFLDS